MSMINTIHIDRQFVPRLYSRVDKIVDKGSDVWNLRCPLCGDSQLNKRKMRGYIYPTDTGLAYKCHNCSASTWFGTLLQKVDPQAHHEYTMALFATKASGANPNINRTRPSSKPKFKFAETVEVTKPEISHLAKALEGLEVLSALPKTHPARKYIEGRRIPAEFMGTMRYAPSFPDWLKETYPEKAETLGLHYEAYGRIIIPAFLPNKDPFALTARALGDTASKLRYMSINESEHPLVFGLERLDPSKRAYATEGYFDAMFLPNSIAAGGSGLTRLHGVGQLDLVNIFDNEPRSRIICGLMEGAINAGRSVFFWPPMVGDTKDINDAVLKMGLDQAQLVDMIERNTANGLMAKNKLAFWRKT